VKKIVILIMGVLGLVLLQGCSSRPSDEELSKKGYLLSDAIDEFNALEDNYAYQYELHQTNGEDWFAYTLAKFYQGDIYFQSDTYHSNTGWQNKELILTYYTDLSEIPYQIYDVNQDGSVRNYYKFKYYESDETFQKLYKDLEQEDVPKLDFDYDCFKTKYFENVYDKQTEITTNEWHMTSDYLGDIEFKEDFIEGLNLFTSAEEMRVDYLYLLVNDSLVTQLKFGYWGGYDDQNMYHYTIDFSRDQYIFDIGELTTGFVDYQTVIDD